MVMIVPLIDRILSYFYSTLYSSILRPSSVYKECTYCEIILLSVTLKTTKVKFISLLFHFLFRVPEKSVPLEKANTRFQGKPQKGCQQPELNNLVDLSDEHAERVTNFFLFTLKIIFSYFKSNFKNTSFHRQIYRFTLTVKTRESPSYKLITRCISKYFPLGLKNQI